MPNLQSRRLAGIQRFAGDDVSLPHMVASAAILRAYKIVSMRVEAALAPLDLTASRFEVLGLLNDSDDGRLSFGELKRATLLHSATMTYTIDGLEKSKLIKRRPHVTDRRVVMAEITPRGRDLARQATAVLSAINFGLADLPEAKADRTATLLSALHAT